MDASLSNKFNVSWGNFVPWGMKFGTLTKEYTRTITKDYRRCIDSWTGQTYTIQEHKMLRFKHFLLATIGQIAQVLALTAHACYRMKRVVTLSSEHIGKDLLHIIATPLVFIGLWVTAAYGIFAPYNGQKVYASIERAHFGLATPEVKKYFELGDWEECTLGDSFFALGMFGWRMAPCFQPEAARHGISKVRFEDDPNAI